MLHTKNKSGASYNSSFDLILVKTLTLVFPSRLDRTQPSPLSANALSTSSGMRPACSQSPVRPRYVQLPRLFRPLQRSAEHGSVHDGSLCRSRTDCSAGDDVQSVSIFSVLSRFTLSVRLKASLTRPSSALCYSTPTDTQLFLSPSSSKNSLSTLLPKPSSSSPRTTPTRSSTLCSRMSRRSGIAGRRLGHWSRRLRRQKA
jgi:hypothetical protein